MIDVDVATVGCTVSLIGCAVSLGCALYCTMVWGKKCKHGVRFLCSECRNGDKDQREVDEHFYTYWSR